MGDGYLSTSRQAKAYRIFVEPFRNVEWNWIVRDEAQLTSEMVASARHDKLSISDFR